MEQKEPTTKRKVKGRPFISSLPISPEMDTKLSIVECKLDIKRAVLVREAIKLLLEKHGEQVADVHPLHGGTRPAGSYYAPGVLDNGG